MIDEPTASSDADDRAVATRELHELADNWKERERKFDEKDAGAAIEQRSLWGDAAYRFSRNKIAMIALVLMGAFGVLAIIVPSASRTADANVVRYSQAAKSPSLKCLKVTGEPHAICHHPFGTDQQGRDLWVRTWDGARISLMIAFSVAFVILIAGVLYGSISGYVGGRVDNIMMRILDTLYGLPYLPFAIIFVVLVKEKMPENASPLWYMVPALSATSWFTAARIIRGQILSLKENEYIDAAHSSGARAGRIIFRHLVPNTIGVLIIAVFLEVPNAILGEATLSFLGLGVNIPKASWGSLANDGYQFFRSHPFFIAVPGALIASTVLCSIAIADGLRDALDPRGRSN